MTLNVHKKMSFEFIMMSIHKIEALCHFDTLAQNVCIEWQHAFLPLDGTKPRLLGL